MKFNFASKVERQAENFRRMFLAVVQDIWAIVVKLGDRLHNMGTLTHLPPAKPKRITSLLMCIVPRCGRRKGNRRSLIWGLGFGISASWIAGLRKSAR
jgi:(p)ppGpp synthase/HD superfamily hydrolase